MDRSRYSRELIEKFEAEYRMYSALPQEGRRYLIFTEYNLVMS